jgi:hypothetical protein
LESLQPKIIHADLLPLIIWSLQAAAVAHGMAQAALVDFVPPRHFQLVRVSR